MLDKIIKTDILYREIAIPREAIDKDKRTVELSFSSETPVERYFGFEILDHSTGSVRLDRLNNGGQLLFNHDTDDYRGVIEFAKISEDRRGKALVRFSRSQKADEIFQDVQDGIIRNVSVGYLIHKMILESEVDGVSTYRAVDWEPIEVSLVTIPADTSVGVGRNSSSNHQTIIQGEKQCLKDSTCTDSNNTFSRLMTELSLLMAPLLKK